MLKKKIIIFIPNEIYLNNYIENRVFDLLEEKYNVAYIVEKNLQYSSKINNLNILFFYGIGSFSKNLFYRLSNLLMWKNKGKSISFKYRIERLYGYRNATYIKRSPGYTFYRFLRNYFYILIFNIFSNRLLFSVTSYLVNLIFLWTLLKVFKVVRHFNPSLMIIPTSAADPDAAAVSILGEVNSIETMFIVDNWDNLTSKTVLWKKPNYIIVWGQQSKEQAVDIQNIYSGSIFAIGTARFDQYFKLREVDLPSPFAFEYILLVGTTLPSNEAQLVSKVDEIIENNKKFFNGLKVVYRPHPWRQGKDKVNFQALKNTIIDPSVKKAYLGQERQLIGIKPLDYASLIKNSKFVLGGLTSMVIESLIFYKKFLAVVYDDKSGITNPMNVYESYLHFMGLDEISAISFCKNEFDLEDMMKVTYQNSCVTNKVEIDKQRHYYCFANDESYSKRLADVVYSLVN